MKLPINPSESTKRRNPELYGSACAGKSETVLSIMKHMCEKDLQEAICQYLNLREIPFFRQRMDRRTTGTLGQPDFLCCIKGKFAAIECKVGPNGLTDEQKAVQERLLAAGGRYDVVRTLQEAIEAIKSDLEDK